MPDLFEMAAKAVDDQQEGAVTPRYDGKNRYLIPDPDNPGKTIAWTRATNLAKVLAETEALQRWGERMVVQGLTQRGDLLAQAQSVQDPASYDGRKTLDRVARAAKDAAGAWTRANQGTSLHTLTERVDTGKIDPAEINTPWGGMIRAYVDAMNKAGVTILPEHVERTVIVKRFKVAGTFDRIVRMPNGELWIADLKTGRSLDYSMGDIAIQLALYAHADAIYDFELEQFLPMPEVSQTQALIMHMPVEATGVTLHRVNIIHGWEAAHLAEKVKHWRKFKGLSEPVVNVPVEAEDLGLSQKWVGRIVEAKSADELGLIWREATAAGEWTDALTEFGKEHLKGLIAGNGSF